MEKLTGKKLQEQGGTVPCNSAYNKFNTLDSAIYTNVLLLYILHSDLGVCHIGPCSYIAWSFLLLPVMTKILPYVTIIAQIQELHHMPCVKLCVVIKQ